MNKCLLLGIAIIVMLIVLFFALNSYIYNEKQATVAIDYKGADFTGEAAPSSMSLDMKTWIWEAALYSDGREVDPAGEHFSITFLPNNQFSATTDCNSVGGSYTTAEETIAFSEIFMTKMFCGDSQEAEFLAILENASNYHFTGRGELIIDLKFYSGTATFR